MGYSPRGCKELAMTERLHFHFYSEVCPNFVYGDHYLYCFEEQNNLSSALRRNTFSAFTTYTVYTWSGELLGIFLFSEGGMVTQTQ